MEMQIRTQKKAMLVAPQSDVHEIPTPNLNLAEVNEHSAGIKHISRVFPPTASVNHPGENVKKKATFVLAKLGLTVFRFRQL
jgi:hypothetical protein